MKKIILTLIGIAMIFQFVQCSTSTSSTRPKPVEEPAVASCKTDCNTAYGKCMQNAGNNESKKSACTSGIVKCSQKCDTKAKGYKKEQPAKYQKSPEI